MAVTESSKVSVLRLKFAVGETSGGDIKYKRKDIKKSILIGLNNGDINISLEEKFDEHLVLLLLVVPIQIMSYKIATFKGIDLGIRIFDDFDKVLKSKI